MVGYVVCGMGCAVEYLVPHLTLNTQHLFKALALPVFL